jgi:hypothetical protein
LPLKYGDVSRLRTEESLIFGVLNGVKTSVVVSLLSCRKQQKDELSIANSASV